MMRLNGTRLFICLVISMLTGWFQLFAQDSIAIKNDSTREVDVMDILRKIFKKTEPTEKKSTNAIAILPSLGYNPSFGFIIGAKISGGKQFGDPATTDYSIFSLEGMYTSKGILSVQA